MAVVALGLLGTGSATTAGTTLAVVNTTGAIIPAGTFIHITGTWDNIASVTAPTITCSAVGGGTAVANHGTAIGAGVTTTAGSGVWHTCFRVLTTASIAIGATIATLTSNQSAVKRAAIAVGWSGVTTTQQAAATTSTGASGLIAPTSFIVNSGNVLIGSGSFENNALPTGSTDATGGTWSAIVGTFTTGGAANTNVGVCVQSKTATATADIQWNVTSANDVVGCGYAVQPAPDPAVTQAAYRWYAEGTESGAVALAAQDTAVVGDITNGDATGTLRIRLQSTTAVAVSATDDWQLQYEKNASGTWVNVSASSVAAATYDSPNLTNQAATTNRLTGGTGSFVAGKISEDSLMDDLGWGANNFTELVYALKIKAADVVSGDTLRFRVLRNAATTGMTYTQTPTISVTQTIPAVTQAAYRFYTDGAEAGTLADSYEVAPTGNANTLNAAPYVHGQSFMGDGRLLVRAGFWLSKSGTPPGNWTAKLYAHTGTYGAGGTGVDPVLATSTPRAISSVINTAQWEYFTFDGTFTLAAGTPYVIGLEHSVTGDVSNLGEVWNEITVRSHGGNRVTRTSAGVWAAITTSDTLFRVYTDNALAAQDTAYTADLTAGDVNLQLRTRLQSTSTANLPSSDWQLQVEKNASGTWSDIIGSGVVDPYNSPNVTEAAATTNRLGAGSGSFAAGEVSEVGLVTTLGWPGNNYTEVLYALTLKKANLVNGDTLRFRVLRNSATTGMTYTATPTVNVTVVTRPTATRATTWAALASVSASRGTTWKTLASVSVTPPTVATWRVLAPVNPSWPTTWNVAGRVTTTLATSWKVTTQVSTSRATTWTVGTPVTTTKATTWNVLLARTATRPTTWQTRTGVSVSRATTWDVALAVVPAGGWIDIPLPFAVPLTASTAYVASVTTDGYNYGSRPTAPSSATPNLTGPVGYNAPGTDAFPSTPSGSVYYPIDVIYHQGSPRGVTSWSVLTSVSLSRATTWDVAPGFAQVSTSRSTTWTVKTPASTTKAATWHSLASVTASRPTLWDVARQITQVSASRTTTWDVARQVTQITASRSTTWQAPASLTTTKVATWNVLSARTATKVTSWHLLAPMTTTRVTTWHAPASVTTTKTTTWHTQAAVTGSRPTLWDVARLITSVTTSRSTTWDVARQVTQLTVLRSTTWHASAPVTQIKTTTWHTLAPLAVTKATTWHVRGPVAVTRLTTWHVPAALTATKATTWHTEAAVAATRAVTWHVRGPVATTRGVLWNVFTPVSTTKATTWHVQSPLTASRVTSWNVFTPVATTRPTTWHVLSGVNTTRATTWTVQAPVTLTRLTTWHARAGVSTTRATLWDVVRLLTQVTVSRPTTWDVARQVTQLTVSRSTTWSVPANIQLTRPTTWSVLTPATTTRSTTWKVTAPVALTRTVLWTVQAPISATRAVTWRFLSSVATTKATTWTADVGVSITRATTWDVAAQISQITASRSTLWHLGGRFTVTRVGLWSVLTPASTTRPTTWVVLASQTQTRATTWRTTAPLTATRATTWHVRGALSATTAATWHVLSARTATTTAIWNVLSARTATRATTWHVVGPLAVFRATTWHIGGRTTVTRDTTWNTKAASSRAVPTTWAVLSARTASKATSWHTTAALTTSKATAWHAKAAVTNATSTAWRVTTAVPVARATTWTTTALVDQTKTTYWATCEGLTALRTVTWWVGGRASISRSTTWHVRAGGYAVVDFYDHPLQIWHNGTRYPVQTFENVH